MLTSYLREGSLNEVSDEFTFFYYSPMFCTKGLNTRRIPATVNVGRVSELRSSVFFPSETRSNLQCQVCSMCPGRRMPFQIVLAAMTACKFAYVEKQPIQ